MNAKVRRDKLNQIITEEEYQYGKLMKLVRLINSLRVRKDKVLQKIKYLRDGIREQSQDSVQSTVSDRKEK